MNKVGFLVLFFVAAVAVLQVQGEGWGKEHFFQYANVPGWDQYEFGYHRGNDKHFTSRFEKAHGWTFKTKVRWGDKSGWGEQYYDYNHHDKGHKKGGWGEEKKKGWGGGQQGAFSEHVQQQQPYEQDELTQLPRQPSQQLPQQQQPQRYYQRHAQAQRRNY